MLQYRLVRHVVFDAIHIVKVFQRFNNLHVLFKVVIRTLHWSLADIHQGDFAVGVSQALDGFCHGGRVSGFYVHDGCTLAIPLLKEKLDS